MDLDIIDGKWMIKMTGLTIWFTGLPSSGKTTIAKEIYNRVKEITNKVEFLDGDSVREYFDNKDFSKEGRNRHIKQIGFMANLLTKQDALALCTFVSPYREVREFNKRNSPNYLEVFVDCTLAECMKRDVKGLYKKALAGEIKGFTGIDDPYEPPLNPDIILYTDKQSIDECVDIIMSHIKFKEFIKYSSYLVKGEEPNKGPSLFIGRYQTFHKGHKTLMQTVLDEGKDIIIALRDTKKDNRNPFSIEERVSMIKKEFPEAVVYPEIGKITIVSIPDMSEVVFGRGVGWSIRKIKLDKEIESISATKLRKEKLNDSKETSLLPKVQI